MRTIESKIAQNLRSVINHDVDTASLLEKVHQTRDAKRVPGLRVLEQTQNLTRWLGRRVQCDDVHVHIGLSEAVEYRLGFADATIFRQPPRRLGKRVGLENDAELHECRDGGDGKHVAPSIDHVRRE